MLSPGLILSFVFGVSLHVFAFRHGEWDLVAHKLLITAAASPLVLFLGLLLPSELDLWSTLTKSLGLVVTCLLGTYLSMLVYRSAFHRLNHFPGPFLARLSNFYLARLALKSRQEYLELEKLHKKYGDVVRIGEWEDPPLRSVHMLIRSQGPRRCLSRSQRPSEQYI